MTAAAPCEACVEHRDDPGRKLNGGRVDLELLLRTHHARAERAEAQVQTVLLASAANRAALAEAEGRLLLIINARDPKGNLEMMAQQARLLLAQHAAPKDGKP